MQISILCTDPRHPVMGSLRRWAQEMANGGHAVSLLHDRSELTGGDILFLVSCSQIIREAERKKYRRALVLHASDLPLGRGWSPHIWAVLDGKSEITVTLLEASDPVDSGAIFLQTRFALEGHELLPEINEKLFKAELWLMSQAVERFDGLAPVAQRGDGGSALPKRSVADSRLDPHKTIAAQFDLLRVVDSDRYPAFFDYRGKRYLLKIEKYDNDER
jgi:methionyl-tRNA formyltransferase